LLTLVTQMIVLKAIATAYAFLTCYDMIGTDQGKDIVDALVQQSRENLRLKMSDYRTRKAEWEKRLAVIQAGGQIAPADMTD
jgi:hypothetical protein